MLRILDPAQESEVERVRALLADLEHALARFGATPDDERTLAASIRQLDEMFLVVVAGEFNAGKSALINSLLGQAVLREGVTPTTDRIHVLIYGDEVTTRTGSEGVAIVTAPAELLRDLHIVDTPGTNAIIREHEQLTSAYVPRSDLVLFVTAADRPFTETERAFLATIRAWGKKVVVVVNRIDVLATDADVADVAAFVKRGVHDLLGFDAEVLPVSARLALQARHGHPEVWGRSRFEALESYLQSTLDAPRRLRLKLANPVGVGAALASRYGRIAGERRVLLREDVELLQDISRQRAVYDADLAHGFELRMSAIDRVLADMETRGDRFFERTLRIGRVVDLLNRARIQKDFEDEVVADAPQDVERRVGELIDWLVEQDLRQWQAVTAKVSDRHRHHAARVLGAPEIGQFHLDRARLLEAFGRQAQRVVETYDMNHEAETIADQARTAVAAAAAAGGAAVGVGTLVTVAASTVAADVTGILLASVILGVGFLVIPARRRRAKAALGEKIAALRERLVAALNTEFTRARERSSARLDDAIAPYAQFVRTENQRWADAEQTLASLHQRLESAMAEQA